MPCSPPGLELLGAMCILGGVDIISMITTVATIPIWVPYYFCKATYQYVFTGGNYFKFIKKNMLEGFGWPIRIAEKLIMKL